MQRITKRNEQGGIDVDCMPMVLERLAEYEDTGLEPSAVKDLKISYNLIAKMHDCGNCAKSLECEYSDQLRMNCSAWEGTMNRWKGTMDGKDEPEDEPHEIKAYRLDEPFPDD